MTAHLKYNAATGHLLKNASNHLVNECTGCNVCDPSSSMGRIFRVTVPASTFADGGGETCAAQFNGATFDLTTGHPLYAAPCVRALDISDIVCDTQVTDAIVATFASGGPVLQFLFGSGNFITFLVSGLGATYDCAGPFTLAFDSNNGSPPITSSGGKTVTLEKIA